MFIPITKVDVAQRLVYGTLTEEIADKSGEILDYETAKPAFEKWSKEISDATGGKSLGNVRAMHGSIAAGKFTDISYDDKAKRIEGCAKIVDDGEWNKVLEGVYTGFSIGGGYAKRWQDPNNPKLKRYTPVLAEVSIVDNPCVGSATFQCIKADGSVELRKFNTTATNEDSMDPKAIAEAREALAKGTATDEQKALVATADAELLKAAQDADSKGEATDEQKELLSKADAPKVETTKDGKPLKPTTGPVQKWEASDGKTFLTKREAEIHNLEIEKQAELAPAMAKMEALLKGDDANSAEKTTDEKPADAAKAAESEVSKAADAKPAEEANKAANAGTLTKGLYDIGWFANILGDIKSFTSNAEWEAMFEGDDSTLPGQLRAWLKDGAALLTAYVAQEASALAGDADVLAMAAKMDSGHAAALVKHVKDGALKTELEKAGARHSKSDKESLMAIHKAACDQVGAIEKCFKGLGIMADDAEKAAQSAELTKFAEVNGVLQMEVNALTKVVADSNETLLKAVNEIKAGREENRELAKTNTELTKRIEHLEAQPMPAKGQKQSVSKSQDSGGTGDGKPEPEKVAQDLSKLSPNDRVHVLMKDALAHPVAM